VNKTLRAEVCVVTGHADGSPAAAPGALGIRRQFLISSIHAIPSLQLYAAVLNSIEMLCDGQSK